MTIKIVRRKISHKELTRLAKENYGNMIKGVADIQRRILALGGELHADAETLLLEDGSQQETLWGFNLFLDRPADKRIEYLSFINIRPAHGNRSMEIADQKLKEKIKDIIDTLVSTHD